MSGTRPIVLVVDDEPEVLRSVYDLFRLEFRILTAERGSDALRMLAEEDVQVILSDQRMPEMTGVDLLRQASLIRPDATRLLFTGYADLGAVIDSINKGNIFRYISKPWEVDELQQTLRQAVERNQLIRDKRRLIEELERNNRDLAEANAVKERFIEVASHELNTPVGVVLGLAELWKITQGPQASPNELAWIDRIQHAGERLAAIVERIGQLLRAERFETLDLRPTELAPLIRQAIEQVDPFRLDRRQQFEVFIDPNLGKAVVDPSKLGDLLANLLINAIKFTPDGGTIRIAAGPDGDDEFRIEVADNGVGIATEDRRYLFEPFYTGRDTRHHSSGVHEFGRKGIGLGLRLVKTFVDLHGGRVEVESEEQRGTLFRVRMPRRPGDGNGKGGKSSSRPAYPPEPAPA
ncbi:MAG: hybrid sensor histidine kinase/response regulator [Isosphaeraceae bacterium]